MSEELKEVDIAEITVNPYQPRRHFEEEELEGLALSIKAVGLIHPPVVTPSLELISGERRYRALQMAGYTKIPVIVRSSNTSHSAQAALIENVQRVDLNPLEIAYSLRRLITDFGLNQEELADRIGKKRSTVANYLRLLTLPSAIQESIKKELISMGHAKAILSLEKGQELLHEMILRDQMSVRKAEETAQKLQEKKSVKTEKTPSLHLQHVADMLQRKWGTRVSIQGSHEKGRLSIDYYRLDELEAILQALGWEEE